MAHLWIRAEQRGNEQRVDITPFGVTGLVKADMRSRGKLMAPPC